VSARHEAERLLADLLRAGAIPVLEDGRLRIEAPTGVLTAARRERVAGSLPELRALVASRWRSREECIAAVPCRRMSPCTESGEGRPCLVPATCCVCGADLEPDHRYLCLACADVHPTVTNRSCSEGEAQL
jgi:hypothetical protein